LREFEQHLQGEGVTAEPRPLEGTTSRFKVPTGRIHNIFGIVFGVVALVWVGTRIDLTETLDQLRKSNYPWFVLGFVVFYISLPLRAWRWQLMLRNLGLEVPLAALAGTIFRAWTVNCIVPGRAGDVYGAFALRQEQRVSGAATAGSILGARVLDLLMLIGMVTLAFYLRFRTDAQSTSSTLVWLAWSFAAVALGGLLLLARSGPWMERKLPPRIATAWSTFRHATFRSVRRVPMLLLVTLCLWLLEVCRLWCVLGAVGAPRPLFQVTLLALVAAMVTTLPITPAGLGTVEALYSEFLPDLGITSSVAVSAAILDRMINYWFILFAGSAYFLLFRRRHRKREA
jgi:uncharacterized protein (TIRG00374 family)